MGLFSSRKTLGSMRFDFYSRVEVAVTDTIPDGGENIPYPIWFAFMCTAKLLNNFSDKDRRSAVQDAIRTLAPMILDDDQPRINVSLLGVCCTGPLQIVDHKGQGKWVYEGTLEQKGEDLPIKTKIAWGDEEHFHRATIDAIFEQTRMRFGDEGDVIAQSAMSYFLMLHDYGCSNPILNYSRAGSTAAMAAAQLGYG